MKGIILAGGLGSRLYSLTKTINKHLLPIYNKPMIFYPVEFLIKNNIKNILIITGGNYAGAFVELLENGLEFGAKLHYEYQKGNGGIAEALGLAEDFANKENICVILGDNIFLMDIKKDIIFFRNGAQIFITKTSHASRFGVVELINNKIISIIEKPKKPKSNYVVTGLYIYDKNVFNFIKQCKPSRRRELEITDVNNMYLKEGKLQYRKIKGFWRDCGTIETLYEASKFMRKQCQKTQKKN